MQTTSILQLKLMRLLTLLCFFQFSGLNNGYTLLCEVSPLSVSQSVLPVQAFAAGFRGISQISGFTHSLNSGRRWIINLALGIENFLSSLEAPASFSGKKRAAILPASAPVSSKSISISIGEKKEEYLKQEKENWVRPKAWYPVLKELWNPIFLSGNMRGWEIPRTSMMNHRAPAPWTVPKFSAQRLNYSSGDEDPALSHLSGRFLAVTPDRIWGDFFRSFSEGWGRS